MILKKSILDITYPKPYLDYYSIHHISDWGYTVRFPPDEWGYRLKRKKKGRIWSMCNGYQQTHIKWIHYLSHRILKPILGPVSIKSKSVKEL